MSTEALITLAAVVVMLIALARELFAPDVIVFSTLGILLLTNVISVEEALQGFSNSGVLTVALLFIIAFAAQSSGILELFAAKVMGKTTNGRKALWKMMIPVAALSAFLNNTPIVAMFTPTIRDWAIKHKLPPSKFLIPLSYAAMFGGICTLIGTSTNLVVNGLYQRSLNQSLSMFELAWIGIPCALAGMIYLWTIGYRLLPDNPDLSEEITGSGREYLLEMSVAEEGPLIGKTIQEAGLQELDHLILSKIIRNNRSFAVAEESLSLQAKDRLLFVGMAEGVAQIQRIPGLTTAHGRAYFDSLRQNGNGRVIEAVVSRSSPMLGKTLREGQFRARYDAVLLALHRHGETLTGGSLLDLVLKPGDTLLLLSGDDFFKRWNQARDFYMISKLSDVPTVNRKKSILSLLTLLGMVLLSAFGIISLLKAVVLATMILLFTRAVTVVEARRSIELNVVIVIASALGIAKAIESTGMASALAGWTIQLTEGLGPLGLLATVYLLTAVMTEVITNNAAAAISFPVAIAIAAQAGLDPKPFVITLMVAASASFSTPIGYQTNMMVYGPGGYTFLDFLKVGIPLNLLFMAVTLLVVPLVWPF